MKVYVLSGLWLMSMLTGWGVAQAQSGKVDAYRARVLTFSGNRYSGLLDEVTESEVYLTDQLYGRRFRRQTVPLDDVRKVTLRRSAQSTALLTGAVLGALATGYLASQSLRSNQPRSPVAAALTLTFAAAGGGAGGLLIGSAVGRLPRRVVRPLSGGNPATSLFRQLEPLSVRYQERFLNRQSPIVP